MAFGTGGVLVVRNSSQLHGSARSAIAGTRSDRRNCLGKKIPDLLDGRRLRNASQIGYHGHV